LVNHNSSTPFQLIDSDVWQSPTPSHTGFCYYVIFIDDFSHFTWVYPMKRKSEVFKIFRNFKTMIENQFAITIKIFQSDEMHIQGKGAPYVQATTKAGGPIGARKYWVTS